MLFAGLAGGVLVLWDDPVMTRPFTQVQLPDCQGNWQYIEKLVAGILAGTSPTAPVVTSLPASPVDGQEVYYLADATNGVMWRLRYRAGSASAYKWEVVGEATGLTATGTNTSSSTTTLSLLSGPQIVIPLAGDYRIRYGFKGALFGATSGGSAHGQAFYNNASVGIDLQVGGNPANVGTDGAYWSSGSAEDTVTLSPAAANLEVRNRALNAGAGAGTAYFQNRWLEAVPRRVG